MTSLFAALKLIDTVKYLLLTVAESVFVSHAINFYGKIVQNTINIIIWAYIVSIGNLYFGKVQEMIIAFKLIYTRTR